ncbi:MAG: sugar ABC transporter ATP-binding protein [Phycisphaerales bacterium]
MTTAAENAILVCEGVCKRFGPTVALDGVSVAFRAGEVHALMGENGAGKSTLGKAIAGLHMIDAGTITLAGRALVPGSLEDAFSAGVRIVHQELAQCPNLSVAENLCLHDLPTRMGLLDRGEMNRRARGLLARLAPEIDVQAPLGTLAPGRRQIVQIAGALDERVGTDGKRVPAARVIVFDEPTSSLSIAEADRLMQIVRRLAGEGLLCIYVSHRMGEIFACCDRVSVLRDGRFIGTSVVREIDEKVLVGQMIGRTIQSHAKRTAADFAKTSPALEVRSLRSPGRIGTRSGEGGGIGLVVRPGEILGVGGLVGAGRSELLDAIFGLDSAARGDVLVAGTPLPALSTRCAIKAGLGYVPEDRRLQGLFFQLGIGENIVAPVMPELSRGGLRSTRREQSVVAERMGRFRVKAASAAALPGELSGGNQQKLLIARWMHEGTRVLLLDEPTRGIDVGTKSEVYRLIFDAADAGLAVLLVSSEMSELLALADRIIVLCEGDITGELTGADMTQENILRMATTAGAARIAGTTAAA